MCEVKGTEMSNPGLNRRFHIILRKLATSMPETAVQQLLSTYPDALRAKVRDVLAACVSKEPPTEEEVAAEVQGAASAAAAAAAAKKVKAS